MKNNKTVQRVVAYIMIIGILSSCNRYNLIEYTSDEISQKQESFNQDLGDYVVVHKGDESWRILGAKIENGQITGELASVDQVQEEFYSKALDDNLDEVEEENKEGVYQEQTHIYVSDFEEIDGSFVVISAENITNTVALKQNAINNGWRIVRNILLVIGGLILGMAIFLVIVCNCPHAYTFDGQSYHFTNTLFTGATAANLERNDYKILQDFRPESESYEMYIKNEENESHYTNLLELLVVNHDANVQVIPDQKGTIHSITNLKSASKITNENGEDLSRLTSYQDEQGYLFDNQTKEDLISTYATFDKPADVSNAKIVLNLRNTEWGGVVYKTFAAMMGDKYENWVEKNHERTPEEAITGMKEAGIPLVVSIKKDNQWIEVEDINLVGEVSYNSLVVPIDEELITGQNIELRLQAGFKFWDLDYVGMDFSPKIDVAIETIKPSIAQGTSNDLSALASDDELYMEHNMTGDSTYLKFEGLKTTGEKRTIIMRSKGYYISKDVYAGTPYWKELLKLRAPYGISRLSKDLYNQFVTQYAFQTAD